MTHEPARDAAKPQPPRRPAALAGAHDHEGGVERRGLVEERGRDVAADVEGRGVDLAADDARLDAAIRRRRPDPFDEALPYRFRLAAVLLGALVQQRVQPTRGEGVATGADVGQRHADGHRRHRRLGRERQPQAVLRQAIGVLRRAHGGQHGGDRRRRLTHDQRRAGRIRGQRLADAAEEDPAQYGTAARTCDDQVRIDRLDLADQFGGWLAEADDLLDGDRRVAIAQLRGRVGDVPYGPVARVEAARLEHTAPAGDPLGRHAADGRFAGRRHVDDTGDPDRGPGRPGEGAGEVERRSRVLGAVGGEYHPENRQGRSICHLLAWIGNTGSGRAFGL